MYGVNNRRSRTKSRTTFEFGDVAAMDPAKAPSADFISSTLRSMLIFRGNDSIIRDDTYAMNPIVKYIYILAITHKLVTYMHKIIPTQPPDMQH